MPPSIDRRTLLRRGLTASGLLISAPLLEACGSGSSSGAAATSAAPTSAAASRPPLPPQPPPRRAPPLHQRRGYQCAPQPPAQRSAKTVAAGDVRDHRLPTGLDQERGVRRHLHRRQQGLLQGRGLLQGQPHRRRPHGSADRDRRRDQEGVRRPQRSRPGRGRRRPRARRSRSSARSTRRTRSPSCR